MLPEWTPRAKCRTVDSHVSLLPSFEEDTIVIPISYTRNPSSEKLNNLPTVTQPIHGRIQAHTQAPASTKPTVLDTLRL